PLFAAPVVNAIENLWNDQTAAGNTGNIGAISAGEAATFQVALWDIINNYNGQTGASAGLLTGNSQVATFNSPGNGFTSGELTAAYSWAAQAYAGGTYNG